MNLEYCGENQEHRCSVIGDGNGNAICSPPMVCFPTNAPSYSPTSSPTNAPTDGPTETVIRNFYITPNTTYLGPDLYCGSVEGCNFFCYGSQTCLEFNLYSSTQYGSFLNVYCQEYPITACKDMNIYVDAGKLSKIVNFHNN